MRVCVGQGYILNGVPGASSRRWGAGRMSSDCRSPGGVVACLRNTEKARVAGGRSQELGEMRARR